MEVKGEKPVLKIRARLRKGDEVRFISHLDLTRTMERAVRRAGLPVAFSQGFHPHPRISFGPALATGITSDAEYLDFELSGPLSVEDFISCLNSQLPPGLEILEARAIPLQAESLTRIIDAALYWLYLRKEDLLSPERLKQAEQQGPFLDLWFEEANGGFRLGVLVSTKGEGAIKAGEILPLLRRTGALKEDAVPLKIHRVGQFVMKDGKALSPLEYEDELLSPPKGGDGRTFRSPRRPESASPREACKGAINHVERDHSQRYCRRNSSCSHGRRSPC